MDFFFPNLILTKATLLSFKIVTSHNYAPLRSAIHVLETLQEVFLWDGVQKPRHVSLDVRNIVKLFIVSLSRGNRQKSGRLRSGEYGGCSICTPVFLPGTV
ncbi:hypothetical protein TNCV_1053991 [Trichonephila clavipes]|nr:hypothetical protein TNCV_1053991 [Trichonephila clavipes]